MPTASENVMKDYTRQELIRELQELLNEASIGELEEIANILGLEVEFTQGYYIIREQPQQ